MFHLCSHFLALLSAKSLFLLD